MKKKKKKSRIRKKRRRMKRRRRTDGNFDSERAGNENQRPLTL